MNSTSFRPVRGTEKTIETLPITNGYVYFATDSGKMYLDKETERIQIGGGSGAVIFYGNSEEKLVEDSNTELYSFPKDYLENQKDKPKIDDIILNVNDGAFYRIVKEYARYYDC